MSNQKTVVEDDACRITDASRISDTSRISDASRIADEAIAKFLQSVEVGEAPNRSRFIRENHGVRSELESFFDAYDQMEGNIRADGKKSSFVSGQQLGRYNLVRPIGSGAFGTVWLGFDSQLKRPVAIKVPNLVRFANQNQRELFLSEAQIVAQLEHPNIVPIYDVGETDAGEIFLVSRFVAGNDLAAETQNRRYSYAEAANCVALIASALEYARGRNLIHRDVKPSNILIDATTRQPYITDFGLAHISDLQSEGSIVGTPAYMSPEQASGKTLDHRSDLFSLGVVFFELLCGSRPFSGKNADAVMKSIREDTPSFPNDVAPQIPIALQEACLKSLSKSFNDRYGSVTKFKSDLQAYLKTVKSDETLELPHDERALQSGSDGSARTVTLSQRATLWSDHDSSLRRSFKRILSPRPILAAAAVLAIGAVVLFTLLPQPVERELPRESSSLASQVSLDRQIAEKTIQLGGHIDFRHNGDDYEVDSIDAIHDGEISLQWIMFDNHQVIDGQFFSSLRSLENLVGIDLHSCQFAASEPTQLALVKSLEYVYLAKSNINDVGVSGLARLPNLKKLNLAETNITADSMRAFKDNKTLESLRLTETRTTDSSLKYIGTMKNLQSLDVSKCRVTDDGVKRLSSLENLRFIDLSETGITAKSFKYLMPCPLQRIVISSGLAKSDAELKFLSTHPNCQIIRE